MKNIGEKQSKKIGHYEVRERLAEGGFGVVYIAHDARLDREVAIKVLHPYHASETTRVARFVREARSTAKLNHPGIVQMYDVVEGEGSMALVMEYVRGKGLNVYLKEHPETTLEQKLEIGAQVAEALNAAHNAGIIHRDVKPANVLMDEDGRAKLTDFGLARLVDNSLTPLTVENNILGTPAYMSPEQCQGHEAGAQSDLYSLGVIIYEMVVGSLPFEAESYLALLRHHSDTPPTPVRLLRPTLPRDLEELVMNCLSKRPESRPASGQEIADGLRRIMARLDETEDPSTTSMTVELRPPSVDDVAAAAEVVEKPEGADGTARSDQQPAVAAEKAAAAPGAKKARWPLRVKASVACVAGLLVIAVGAMVVRSLANKEALPLSVSTLWSDDDPLLDYVTAPDDNYSYSVHRSMPGEGYAAYVLDMASQTWHADKVVPPVWRHWLTIIVPEKINSDKAMLVFTKGLSTADQPLSEVPPIFLAIALTSKSVVAILEGFPRDPVGFHTDTEDGGATDRDEFAVASFMRFLDTGDPTWPIVCPMVKTAVRAMDTVQRYLADDLKIREPVNSFVLTGEANGWGTWLTGAVDDRVAAIAPIQFDLFGISEQIEHQVGFRGELSPYLSLFSETDVMPALDTEEGERLLAIIDPYQYRSRLTMPKLLLLPGSNSPFTTIDSTNLYYEELKGDTYLFCAPNVHLSRGNPFLAQPGSLVTVPGESGYSSQDFRDTLQVFYHKLLVDKPMPGFTWDTTRDGAFRVVTEDNPVEVRLWLTKSDARDFSYPEQEAYWEAESSEAGEEAVRKTWQMEKINAKTEGVYEGKVLLGDKKYTAFYIELVYPSILGINYSLTTPATILTAQETPTQVTVPASTEFSS